METSSAESKIATAKTVLSAAASVAATAMLARSVARDFLPYDIQDHVMFNIRKFLRRFSSEVTMVVDEFDGFVQNQVYSAATTYLGGKISPSTQRFRVAKGERDKDMVITMERDEELFDIFNGVKFKWVFICRKTESRSFFDRDREYRTTESRSFELCFPKKHKEMVLNLYLPHIMRESKSMKQERKTQRIFTVDVEQMFTYGTRGNVWKSVNLDHPATFETLALEPELKERIVKDLDRFVKRRDYYRKVGKAWKRGYLLYGPPGTGKSSLIAAMANYLKFDVFDLELGELRRNSDLRRILLGTANRSILVVEDIDCTIELQDREADPMAGDFMISRRSQGNDKQVTLSGLLNFIDGLWSSCGDERIIVFTTNHKDKLDPALMRPGRMDMHIHMSYCTPCVFKVLAHNYLELRDHPLFQEIEGAIKISQVTPAEVAEQLMRSDGDVNSVLRALISFLEGKKEENEAKKSQLEAKDHEVEGLAESEGALEVYEDGRQNI